MGILNAKTSYTIKCNSDLIYNLVKNHIFKINRDVGIGKGRTLFGQYIEESTEPGKNKYIICRDYEAEGNKILDLTTRPKIIEALASVIGNEDAGYISICKMKLKEKHTDSLYYYMMVINKRAFTEKGVDESVVKYIIDEYEYRGIHSVREKYDILIKTILNPEPENIYQLFKIYNEQNGGYKALCYNIGCLVYQDDLSPYVKNLYKENLNSAIFQNMLLKFVANMINSNTAEELALKLIVKR